MPPSVIAYSGDRHRTQQEFPVAKRVYFASIIVFVTVMAGLIQLGIQLVDTATAQQCRTHDWPADKHAIHMDFCTTYGYPTN